MQDRFKFRSYGKPNSIIEGMQNIYTFEEIEGGYSNVKVDKGWLSFVDKEDLKIMQSTGKKDKHNNLIFEDYILKETYFSEDTDSLTSCLYKVEFDKDVSAFCFTELDGGYKNYLCNFDYKSEDYEIIGNIYENPELLSEVG